MESVVAIDRITQAGKTLWTSVSARSRLATLRRQQAEERQEASQALNVEARKRQAHLSADIDRRLDDNHKNHLAARAGTLRRYDAEKRDYAGKWVERADARRDAWQEFREKWEPLERDRRRTEQQHTNLQTLHKKQRENLRHLKDREESVATPHRRRGRNGSRDDAMER